MNPSGFYVDPIYFDKKNDDYRTENENEVFRIFRRFTAVCKGGKEKATSNFHCLSPSVGMRRLERPTPTSRTQCATNCATFRFCFASAKVKHFFEIKKNFIENLQKICRIKKYAYLCNRKQETIVSERCSITK